MSTRPQSTSIPVVDASFRVLSIDGGGIRGIIPAVLLEALETYLTQALRDADGHEAKPCGATVASRATDRRLLPPDRRHVHRRAAHRGAHDPRRDRPPQADSRTGA
jgi:hypothetical protein